MYLNFTLHLHIKFNYNFAMGDTLYTMTTNRFNGLDVTTQLAHDVRTTLYGR